MAVLDCNEGLDRRGIISILVFFDAWRIKDALTLCKALNQCKNSIASVIENAIRVLQQNVSPASPRFTYLSKKFGLLIFAGFYEVNFHVSVDVHGELCE